MEKLLIKYHDRVPVIIKNDNIKLLIKSESLGKDFMCLIRKKIKMDSKQAIFMFVGKGILIPMNLTIGELYNMYRDEDSILYIEYRVENTFG